MRPAVFTIAAELPFLDALVAGLSEAAGADPLALAGHTVLLPTRRACRALREAFLRAGGGRPMLLPRMSPVGDIDADELALLLDEAEAGPAALELPPAIPELRRRLLLTRLILAWSARSGQGQAPGLTPGQAAPLARALAAFLDEVQAERRDFAGLAGLVPAEYAAHWQDILAFLAILTEHWPRILAEIGCLDPGERRNRLVAAQIEAWRRTPPEGPVIAAGLTGGIPAIADLVVEVAGLPAGQVVLPGLDPAIDPETWGEIAADPTHPQHAMAQLLARLELDPADIRPWRAPGLAPAAPAARRRFVAEALRPAAGSDRWRSLDPLEPEALAGLRRIDCPGPQEEAGTIALLLRQSLERPGATAALVTPDRDLARRVAAELRRWDIEIDDSAGVPLNRTPPGVFLRLVLDLAAEAAAPVPLLAALKHPLAAGGLDREAFRALTRRLETAVLRGPRPAPGLAGIAAALPAEAAELAGFLARLEGALGPLLEAIAVPRLSLAALVAAHIGAAEALAATADETGAERLWRDDAGEAAAEFAAELVAAAEDLPPLAGADYPALFESLLAGPVVRPRYGRHPRLAIWGLLEARLQQADLVVLGGLNEGVWPPRVEGDPWLSRPMRRDFGITPPERRIGLAAHDFAQALGARAAVLTRAVRVEGTPTVPSRWLLRLDTVLRAVGRPGALEGALEEAGGGDGAATLLAWQAALDRPARRLELRPPAPRPPVASRPRRLSVTEIETWMRDPYAIYAKRILRLEALDPLDADPSLAERGIFIHQALDRFLTHYPLAAFPGALPGDAEGRLLAEGRAAFGPALARPGVWAFWWPRFERIARWFLAAEALRRPGLRASRSEVPGRLRLEGPAGPFELTATADRIDALAAGGLGVIDYKTGTLPSPGDVTEGFSPQLPLEAAIAEAGGFTDIPGDAVAELAFWRLSGGDPPGEAKRVAGDAAALRALIDDAVAGLRRLIARFDDGATPYLARPRPDKAPRYSDYGHLARVAEWSEAEEGGG